MSWYLANEDGIIDQFASISGLIDLRNAAGSYAALKDFFEVGATKNTTLCEFQLYRLAKKTNNDSIKSTAKGLAAMMRGETIVWITDGTTGHAGGNAKLKESEDAPSGHPLTHDSHARLIDPIKRRVQKIVARYFLRQKKALLDDIPLRFHVGKEFREASADDEDYGHKRAGELVPEILAPLTMLVTDREEGQYAAAIKLAVERAQKQLADEIATDTRIPETQMSRYVRDNSLAKLTGDFSETTKQRLRSAIAEAINAGGTGADIVSAIKETMEDFTDYRAKLVAQTEVNTAYNFGRHALADAAGMTEKSWVTESGAPCAICLANTAEGWVDINANFSSGQPYPTSHPRCMCSCDFRLVTHGEGK